MRPESLDGVVSKMNCNRSVENTRVVKDIGVMASSLDESGVDTLV